MHVVWVDLRKRLRGGLADQAKVIGESEQPGALSRWVGRFVADDFPDGALDSHRCFKALDQFVLAVG